jgi:hypothetical protein
MEIHLYFFRIITYKSINRPLPSLKLSVDKVFPFISSKAKFFLTARILLKWIPIFNPRLFILYFFTLRLEKKTRIYYKKIFNEEGVRNKIPQY